MIGDTIAEGLGVGGGEVQRKSGCLYLKKDSISGADKRLFGFQNGLLSNPAMFFLPQKHHNSLIYFPKLF